MLQNHLFWLAVALFFLSTANIYIYLEFRERYNVLPQIIGSMGVIGMVGGFVRLVSLSLLFNWWWFLGISGMSLLIIGILAYFSETKIRYFIGIFNILLIPVVWWYGSKLNTGYTFDWFYDLVDAIKRFFS